MKSNISQLIIEKKFREAIEQLHEALEDNARGKFRKQIDSFYAEHNQDVLYDIGLYEFFNVSLAFIETENLDLELFKKLNPEMNVNLALLKRRSGIDKVKNIFTNLRDEAKTTDEKYLDELSNLSTYLPDKKLNILILGESGVGKSYMARVIHKIRGLPDDKFQEINCGEFQSEDRLNQKLFGWEKGSHSYAKETVKGKIEKANGGTLFLDEIDRMPEETRDALITFIDTKKFTRLGAEKDTQVDTCLIFGTNKNLEELVKIGKMEQDFFNRLNQVKFRIPPLRNREGDFVEIINSELNDINKDLDSDLNIDLDAIQWLSEFNWPANYKDLIPYLRMIVNTCIAEGNLNLSLNYLKKHPPVMSPKPVQGDLDSLENILLKYILEFYKTDKTFIANEKHRNFLDGFLKPILAKIYMEDVDDFPKKNKIAMKYIGVSGEQVKSSSLMGMYERYPDLIDKMFNGS